MELREWLIILGLVLVTIIVVDGVRRLQRQRKVPRLDHAQRHEQQGDGGADSAAAAGPDPEAAAREAEINWELPNGGARVVKPATQPTVAPKPKLQRQEHPGPSKVFARRAQGKDASSASSRRASDQSAPAKSTPLEKEFLSRPTASAPERTEASRSVPQAGSEPRGTPEKAEGHVSSPRHDDARQSSQDQTSPNPAVYASLSSPEEESEQNIPGRTGMAAALRSGGQRVSQSMQRMSSAFQRQDESSSPYREPSLGNTNTEDFSSKDPESFADERRDTPQARDDNHQGITASETDTEEAAPDHAAEAQHGDMTPRYSREEEAEASHPVVEKARRHHVSAERARETLAHAEEIIVISVMARTEEGFAGPNLLNLMLACGLRFSEMGIFLRYETEEVDSELQFAMVDVIKPGTFDLENMDGFSTPGVTFLMPLPGATDSSAAFEAMVETAMVLVRNLGGELKDENRSVMTAQTVEFARQRVQEFGRRHRLHRYQAN